MDKAQLNSLMVKVQNGDEQAFTEIYNGIYKGVFSFIYTFVNDYQEAEDILQETFIKVRKNIQSYQPNTNPSAWIFQIAKNLSLDYLRKTKRKNETYSDQMEQYLGSENKSDTKLYVHNLINTVLKDIERQIVILHIIGGYKHKEIATILNLPLGTVLWKYNQSIKLLNNVIKGEQNER